MRIDEKSRPATDGCLASAKTTGRDDVQQRGAMSFDEVEIRLELELRHDDQRRARPHAHQRDDGEAVDVKERQERDRRVLTVDVVPGAVGLQDVRDEVAVREHHAFRQARRAARIRQRDEVVRLDRDARRSAGCRGERVESQDFASGLRGHRARIVERDHVLDGRALDRLRPGRRERQRREQDSRGGVLKLFREIVLRIHRARSRHDRAQSRDREHGNHVFRRVRREDRADVALRNAERGETRRRAIDELGQLRVRDVRPVTAQTAPGVRPAPRRRRARTRRAAWPGCRAADEGCGTSTAPEASKTTRFHAQAAAAYSTHHDGVTCNRRSSHSARSSAACGHAAARRRRTCRRTKPLLR